MTTFFYRIFRRIHNIEAPEPNANAALAKLELRRQPQVPPVLDPRPTNETEQEGEGDDSEDGDSEDGDSEDDEENGSRSATRRVSSATNGSSVVTPITFTQIETCPAWESLPPPRQASRSLVDSDAMRTLVRKQVEVRIVSRDSSGAAASASGKFDGRCSPTPGSR